MAAASKTRNAKQSNETLHRRRSMRSTQRAQEAFREKINPVVIQRAIANPAAAASTDILALQRAYGNRAISHLLTSASHRQPVTNLEHGLPSQARLVVGPAGEKHEQELDRVAEAYTDHNAVPVQRQLTSSGNTLQRAGLGAKIKQWGKQVSKTVKKGTQKAFTVVKQASKKAFKKAKQFGKKAYEKTKQTLHYTFGTDFRTRGDPERAKQRVQQIESEKPGSIAKLSSAISQYEKAKAPGSEERKAWLESQSAKIKSLQSQGFALREAQLEMEPVYLEHIEAQAFKDVHKNLWPSSTTSKQRLLQDVKKQFRKEQGKKTEKTKAEQAEEIIGYVGYVPKGAKGIAAVGEFGAKQFIPKDKEKGKVAGGKLLKMRVPPERKTDVATEVAKGFKTGSDVSSAAGELTGIAGSIAKAIGAIKTWRSSKDEAKKAMAKQDLFEAFVSVGKSIISIAKSVMNTVGRYGGKAAKAFGEKIGLPVISIATNAMGLIQNGYDMIRSSILAIKQNLLLKKTEKESDLMDAMKLFAKRDTFLALGSGIKVILNSTNIICDVTELATGGSAGVATEPIKVVVSVVGTLQDVGTALIESYHAGRAQEAEYKAMASAEGAEQEVFKWSPKFAAAALVERARQKDKLALKVLKARGINEKMVTKSSPENLRAYILRQSKLKEKQETLGQKVVGGLKTAGKYAKLATVGLYKKIRFGHTEGTQALKQQRDGMVMAGKKGLPVKIVVAKDPVQTILAVKQAYEALKKYYSSQFEKPIKQEVAKVMENEAMNRKLGLVTRGVFAKYVLRRKEGFVKRILSKAATEKAITQMEQSIRLYGIVGVKDPSPYDVLMGSIVDAKGRRDIAMRGEENYVAHFRTHLEKYFKPTKEQHESFDPTIAPKVAADIVKKIMLQKV